MNGYSPVPVPERFRRRADGNRTVSPIGRIVERVSLNKIPCPACSARSTLLSETKEDGKVYCNDCGWVCPAPGRNGFNEWYEAFCFLDNPMLVNEPVQDAFALTITELDKDAIYQADHCGLALYPYKPICGHRNISPIGRVLDSIMAAESIDGVPCPNCGGVLTVRRKSRYGVTQHWYVGCPKCSWSCPTDGGVNKNAAISSFRLWMEAFCLLKCPERGTKFPYGEDFVERLCR